MNEKWNNFHRAQLNTSRGPWKSERTRKIPVLQGRQKKEEGKRRGKELGWGLQPCGEMKVRRGLHIRGSPSLGELS